MHLYLRTLLLLLKSFAPDSFSFIPQQQGELTLGAGWLPISRQTAIGDGAVAEAIQNLRSARRVEDQVRQQLTHRR